MTPTPTAPERIAALIADMRHKRDRWQHQSGSLDVVYADKVDDWADLLEALLPALAQERVVAPVSSLDVEAILARLQAAIAEEAKADVLDQCAYSDLLADAFAVLTAETQARQQETAYRLQAVEALHDQLKVEREAREQAEQRITELQNVLAARDADWTKLSRQYDVLLRKNQQAEREREYYRRLYESLIDTRMTQPEAQLAASEQARQEAETLAKIGTWHKDCRPNREMAARELAKSQAVIDKLADAVSAAEQRVQEAEAERDRLRRLAKEATNGWACYAKRNIEHDDIARLHREIDALRAAGPRTND